MSKKNRAKIMKWRRGQSLGRYVDIREALMSHVDAHVTVVYEMHGHTGRLEGAPRALPLSAIEQPWKKYGLPRPSRFIESVTVTVRKQGEQK